MDASALKETCNNEVPSLYHTTVGSSGTQNNKNNNKKTWHYIIQSNSPTIPSPIRSILVGAFPKSTRHLFHFRTQMYFLQIQINLISFHLYSPSSPALTPSKTSLPPGLSGRKKARLRRVDSSDQCRASSEDVLPLGKKIFFLSFPIWETTSSSVHKTRKGYFH